MQRKIGLTIGLSLLSACYTANAVENTPKPVHCDVQIQGSSLNLDEACIRKTPELRRALVDMAVYLQSTDASKLTAPTYHGPVSYTHLDVYKRQPLGYGC